MVWSTSRCHPIPWHTENRCSSSVQVLRSPPPARPELAMHPWRFLQSSRRVLAMAFVTGYADVSNVCRYTWEEGSCRQRAYKLLLMIWVPKCLVEDFRLQLGDSGRWFVEHFVWYGFNLVPLRSCMTPYSIDEFKVTDSTPNSSVSRRFLQYVVWFWFGRRLPALLKPIFPMVHGMFQCHWEEVHWRPDSWMVQVE